MQQMGDRQGSVILRRGTSKALSRRKKKSVLDIVKNPGKSRLIITMKSAKDIPAMDSTGTSDPFAIVTIGDQTTSTNPIKKTLAPVWDEEFLFDVKSPNEILFVDVMDWNRLSSPDFIGRVCISISDLAAKGEGEKIIAGDVWLPLKPKNSAEEQSELGEINVSFTYTPQEVDMSPTTSSESVRSALLTASHFVSSLNT
eukprot:TRINITY_DN1943_c0_g1_i1.p1 TRINITY_DN1943_c0_g1~~TRINITY_DN1943_c0_g1_i1.p1  ORF type:complete len:199 (+),score=36.93 TRINITY_DN1943_c0_g1_i1:264-860(+)